VSVGRALRLGRQLADAAAAVHAAGAVHRDIKPENVFVTAGDDVKLFDFGLVKCAGLTLRTTRRLGSPRYIAPEQLSYARSSGAPLDPRWDVYAIGLVVFELIAGRHPFDFDAVAPRTAAEVIERHLAGGLPRLDAAVPGLPVELADAIARATAREPARRTPSAARLATELAAARTAFQDAYDESAGFLTAELKKRGAEVASDEAPSSENARTLERVRPAWESPPATERLVRSTGPFGTEEMPKLDRAALLAGRRTQGES
jgi:serine/threonine-protein kinase